MRSGLLKPLHTMRKQAHGHTHAQVSGRDMSYSGTLREIKERTVRYGCSNG